jgi:ABC-type bacteriocin/lantibiotic exporter with double-glycine peptidase domain
MKPKLLKKLGWPINNFVVFSAILGRKQKLTVLSVSLCQLVLSFIDLMAVALLGILVSTVIGGFDFQDSENFLVAIFEEMGVQDSQKKTYLLSLIVGIIFITKNILSLILSWKTLDFLSNYQAHFSNQYTKKLLKSSYSSVRHQDPEYIAYSLNDGITAAIVGVIGSTISILGDFLLLLVIFAGLWVVNPSITMVTLVYFFILAIFLNMFLTKWITKFTTLNMDSDLQFRTLLSSVLRLFREISIKQNQDFFSSKLNVMKLSGVKSLAARNWIAQLPKSVIESGMLIGTLGLIVLLGANSGTSDQITTVGIYLAASTRIVPSLLRIQSSYFTIRSSYPAGKRALELIQSLEKPPTKEFDENTYSSSLNKSLLFCDDVTFSHFSNSHKNLFANFNLTIQAGEKVLSGPSGSGKSTLIDLLLGIIHPQKGSVLMEGTPSALWISENKGKISYLPQETKVLNGSVLENICLGEELENLRPQDLDFALKYSVFDKVVSKLEYGLDTYISESNPLLSGGEKQRLGIARALYSKPKIIVLDEASSSMDLNLENQFLTFIESLPDDITVLYITHKLSQKGNFSRMIYLKNGEIAYDGKSLAKMLKLQKVKNSIT